MDEVLKRILDLMKKKKISEKSMEDFLGVPKGSFSNWKRNNGHSYCKYIDIFADRLGVTIDYLMRGYETKDGGMTKDENELLEDYRRLTTQGKESIAMIIKLIISNSDATKEYTKIEGRKWDEPENDEKPTL